MAIEIERKFLLRNTDFKQNYAEKQHIHQGYIEGSVSASVRVRISDSQAYITIKDKTVGFSRSEFEYEIPKSDAKELLNLVCGNKVEKYRYIVWFEGKRWEIDEFLGNNEGLLVAEIELNNENEEINKPDWIGKEVTFDPKYRNSSLAKNPYTNWKVK